VLGMPALFEARSGSGACGGERFDIQVLGLASIAADVSPELALETIASIVVLGAFHASPAVKAAAGWPDCLAILTEYSCKE